MSEHFKIRQSKALEDELQRIEQRASWESCNEGVRERVNFDDTLWGFTLAGGAAYNTPLRVTQIKEGARATHVGIRVGDILKSVNGIDASTLTVQEAHDLILESGLEIKLAIAAPDDEETGHYIYQDELEEDDLKKYKHHQEETKIEDLSYKGAKTNKTWSYIWPCNKKRDILYRESNCFLVPSVYQEKHRTNAMEV